MPKFVLDVTQEEFEKAGGKWITFNQNDPPGKLYFHEIELDMPDWDNVGVSLKFPVRIVGKDDIDAGKEDKLSAGVSPAAVWKLKDIMKELDVALVMQKGADGKKHPVFNSDDVAGKQAVGCWEIQVGSKGGDPTQGQTKYPKLTMIYRQGYKPVVQALV